MTSRKFEDRIRKRAEQLEAAGLRRRLQYPSGEDLSSNDYLGLSTHRLLRESMAEAVLREGCGAAASRLLRGNRACFTEIEQRFAEFKRAEASLYFSSGYAANLGVLSSFVERNDVVFSDELNHASIIDGIRLSFGKRITFPHCDVDRLARLLQQTDPGVQKFLVTESLFSMDGDIAPLERYAELCRETGTVLIVDEAHAVGVFGQAGSGLIEEAGVADSVFVSVNSAGKAIGVAGAFAAGPAWAVDHMIQRARPFVYSTAPPPSVAAAIGAALDIIRDEPERRAMLLKNAALLRSLLREARLDVGASRSQIVPLMVCDNDRTCAIAADLQAAGFDVRAIRPPTVPAGTARLRISLNVNVDEATLRRFAKVLEACCTVCS